MCFARREAHQGLPAHLVRHHCLIASQRPGHQQLQRLLSPCQSEAVSAPSSVQPALLVLLRNEISQKRGPENSRMTGGDREAARWHWSLPLMIGSLEVDALWARPGVRGIAITTDVWTSKKVYTYKVYAKGLSCHDSFCLGLGAAPHVSVALNVGMHRIAHQKVGG